MLINTNGKSLVGVDVDGIQRNFISALIDTYSRHFDDGVKEHDEVLEWELTKSFPQMKLPGHLYEWKDELYLHAKPYDGAVEFMKELNDVARVHIVSAQPKGLEQLTIDWLDKQGIGFERAMFTENKSAYLGHLLIDDHTKNLEEFKNFSVGINRSWNTDSRRYMVDSYDEIIDLVTRL